MSRSKSSSQRATSASSSSRLDLKWYSRPPLETPAWAATASSVSACGPSRRITAPAASSSLARVSPRGNLVRSGHVEPHHTEDDETQARDLQRRRGFAEREHAHHGDQRGADRRPDGVRRPDRHLAQHEREQPERDAVADDDDRDRAGARETVAVAQRDGARDLGDDGEAENDGDGHAL